MSLNDTDNAINDFLKEVAVVIGARQYIIELTSFPSVQVGMFIADKSGHRAVIKSFNQNSIKALMLDNFTPNAGESFYVIGQNFEFPSDNSFFGKIVDPLGNALIQNENAQTKSSSKSNSNMNLNVVEARGDITDAFHTGISKVDLLVPLGTGQRELIIGPPRSGKSGFLRDIIINQRGRFVSCIYVGVGKPIAFINRFSNSVFAEGADEYTTIISAPAGSPSPQLALAVEYAFALAEHLRQNGGDVLLIVDDWGEHAKILREIALLSNMMPGRESYPGDIYFQQASKIERTGKFSKKVGGGSITLLLVLETILSDELGFIETNTMAATDGHIIFSAEMRTRGQLPSIDVGQSVSRVGKQTQLRAQRELSEVVTALTSQQEKLSTLTLFGDELTEETKIKMHQIELIIELLWQSERTFIDSTTQIMIVAFAFVQYFIQQSVGFMRKNKQKLINVITTTDDFTQIREAIQSNCSFEEVITALNKQNAKLRDICLDSQKQKQN